MRVCPEHFNDDDEKKDWKSWSLGVYPCHLLWYGWLEHSDIMSQNYQRSRQCGSFLPMKMMTMTMINDDDNDDDDDDDDSDDDDDDDDD